jgi:TRAP-type C4-dicarboxylate transport system permease small subunit
MKRETFDRVEQRFALMLKWGSVAFLMGLFLLIGAGVFVRFVPIASMGWADEIIELGFAWMVFFGSTVLWRERSHFSVDLIPGRLAGSRAGCMLEIFLGFLCLLFFVILSYEGWVLALSVEDRSPILNFPKIFWYVIVPIAGTMMLGYTVRDMWLLFHGRSLHQK